MQLRLRAEIAPFERHGQLHVDDFVVSVHRRVATAIQPATEAAASPTSQQYELTASEVANATTDDVDEKDVIGVVDGEHATVARKTERAWW